MVVILFVLTWWITTEFEKVIIIIKSKTKDKNQLK